MSDIILTTLNARYIHSSLGLRYLFANMGSLQAKSKILEFTIDLRPIDMAETLLKENPKIIGFGVYIWNVKETEELLAIIRGINPQIKIVLGGPEVSFANDLPQLSQYADYIIAGAADFSFAQLCQSVLAGESPGEKFIQAAPIDITCLQWPYPYYTEEDISNRVIYVEASRGCPFKCEFCLSALDKTAWAFSIDDFLQQMERLYERGARHFKFVDRTFNLKVDNCLRILHFFLLRLSEDLLVHFELIPDQLPEKLRQMIAKFPAGSLQFEIGVQSFNPQVQVLISRKQNDLRTKENIRWLMQHSQAHLHTDLIVGLPGEDAASFLAGFDQLIALGVHEIQVGILKRLRGTPIIRHTQNYNLVFNPHAPYSILATQHMSFSSMQDMTRFARYWDMIGNSGRFYHTLPLILAQRPGERFLRLCNYLYVKTRQTHKIALLRLFELLYVALQECFALPEDQVQQVLKQDFWDSGLKSLPSFVSRQQAYKQRKNRSAKNRQLTHLRQ